MKKRAATHRRDRRKLWSKKKFVRRMYELLDYYFDTELFDLKFFNDEVERRKKLNPRQPTSVKRLAWEYLSGISGTIACYTAQRVLTSGSAGVDVEAPFYDLELYRWAELQPHQRKDRLARWYREHHARA